MIHFDDLIVARILNQQMPEQRQTLMRALESLQAGSGQRGLLAGLVACSMLNMEQAHYVQGMVDRTKRGQLASIYANLLARQGVPADHIRHHMQQLGADGDVTMLGKRVVASGLIPAPQEQQLRFQARVIFDRDQAQQVQAFVQSRHTQGAAPTEQNRSISGVYKLPEVHAPENAQQNPALAIPQATVNKITQQHIAIPQLNLDPPAFEVPDWIDTSDARSGESINEYRILGRIGAGAMGIVYLADHPSEPGRPVALKLLNPDAEEEAKGRFRREILANSFFSHPGVIDVYDAGQTAQGAHYLAMEFFDGEDLEQVLESEERLEATMAIELCRQLFSVLAEAHQAGIVHRDVKPANTLISRDGSQAKLMDFGIAIIRDLGEFEHMVFKTVEGGSTGTPQYMSPEQAAGDQLLAPTDVYSMGLVLYEALSGAFPFESETSSGYMALHMMEDPLPLAKANKACKALPKELHDLFQRLFDKNPDNRPSAGDCADLLGRILPQVEEQKRERRSSTGRFFGFLWRGRGG